MPNRQFKEASMIEPLYIHCTQEDLQMVVKWTTKEMEMKHMCLLGSRTVCRAREDSNSEQNEIGNIHNCKINIFKALRNYYNHSNFVPLNP